MALHQFDAIERLESANENRRGGPGGLTDDVEHEVRAVVKKNVCVTGCEIHGANARRRTAEVMTSGIAGRVCLRFDDAAAEASTGEILDDHFPDEKAGEGDSIDREFRAAKTTDGECWIAFLHGEIVYRPVAPLERDRSLCRSSEETRSWYSACLRINAAT